MSRNLRQTNCDWCGCDEVETVGPDHEITEAEAGRYYQEFYPMIVADAECMVCGAKYLAWVDETKRLPMEWGAYRHTFNQRRTRELDGLRAFFDLSYRESFNDEPAPEDEGIPNVRQHLRTLRELLEKHMETNA